MALPITRIVTCPKPAMLARLVSGSLNEDDADKIFAHIEHCAVCQRRADELAENVDDVVAAARQKPEEDEGARLSGLIRKAQKISTETVEEAPVVRESVSVDSFISGLRRCGLFADEDVDALLSDLPQSDSSAIARQLVARKKLTPFQARVLLKGRWKGLVLGNYIILEKLGQGGMGSVFKAKHRRLGRIVCVKVVNSAGRKSPRMLERFRNEARTVAALSHPNFVVAHDADEAEGVPFLVMEYVEGRDLAREVASSGPLTVEYALRIVQQAASALQYAHDQGVTHRDIKPHNLLVTEDPELGDMHVKILDLGLARFDSLLGESTDASTHAAMTNTGVIMGTVDYMSPEQALRSRDADNRSDIYSLGCTLHFLMTGRPVFDGDTLMARLVAHRETDPPSIEKACPGAPPGLDAVFRRMLAKQPEHRYQQMQEVADDLEAVLNGQTPIAALGTEAAQPESVLEKRRKMQRRPAWGMWAVVCALIAAGAAGVWAVLNEQNAAPAEESVVAASDTDSDDATNGEDGTADPSSANDPYPETLDFGQVARALRYSFHNDPQLADGGRPRAVAILASQFDRREFDALQKACDKYEVSLEIASSREESMTDIHDKDYTLSPTILLDEMKPDDFDMAIVVGGSIGDFEPQYENQTLANFSATFVGAGRVIGATSQQAGHVFEQIDLGRDCRRKKINGVYYGRVAGTGGAVTFATDPGTIEELVNLSIQIRQATLTARRTNQLDENSLAGFGNGRAVIILPTQGFRATDYDLVTTVLDDAGVGFEVMSTELVDAWPADGKRKVAVTMSFRDGPNLSKVRFSNLFDYVFVIGGNSQLLVDQANADLKLILDEAARTGSIVAGLSGDTKKLLNLSSTINDTLPRRTKDGMFSDVGEWGAATVVNKLISREQMFKVFHRMQELRRQALKSHWSNQL